MLFRRRFVKTPSSAATSICKCCTISLQVQAFDAQCGKGKDKGHIKVKGLLPLNAPSAPLLAPSQAEETQMPAYTPEIVLDVKSLDLRVPNTCSGKSLQTARESSDFKEQMK